MTPEEYKHLSAFRKLLEDTLNAMKSAGSQATMAAAVDEYAPRWTNVHDDFAQVLQGIRSQIWSMPFAQVRPVANAVIGHLETTLADVKRQLGPGR